MPAAQAESSPPAACYADGCGRDPAASRDEEACVAGRVVPSETSISSRGAYTIRFPGVYPTSKGSAYEKATCVADSISCGDMSLMCVANDHSCPNGSVTLP